jgi:hypothetical protein
LIFGESIALAQLIVGVIQIANSAMPFGQMVQLCSPGNREERLLRAVRIRNWKWDPNLKLGPANLALVDISGYAGYLSCSWRFATQLLVRFCLTAVAGNYRGGQGSLVSDAAASAGDEGCGSRRWCRHRRCPEAAEPTGCDAAGRAAAANGLLFLKNWLLWRCHRLQVDASA